MDFVNDSLLWWKSQVVFAETAVRVQVSKM